VKSTIISTTNKLALIVLATVCAFGFVGCGAVDMDYGSDTVYVGDQWVYLGAYPRDEVDAPLATALESAFAAGALAKAGEWYAYDGKQYARVVVTNNYVYEDKTDKDFYDFTRYRIGTTHWFEVAPLRWRILNRQGKYAVLMTEELIDAGSYCEMDTQKGYLWENSDLRTWLNDYFYSVAFTSAERSYVETMKSPCYYISNPGRLKYERDSVEDKVRLLEWREARLPEHFADDDARLAQVTDYAASRGGVRVTPEVVIERFEAEPADYAQYMGCGIYWLSDTELNTDNVYIVYEFGFTMSYHPYVKNRGIRPVVTLKTKSLDQLEAAI
jgi:hypothetical protein